VRQRRAHRLVTSHPDDLRALDPTVQVIAIEGPRLAISVDDAAEALGWLGATIAPTAVWN